VTSLPRAFRLIGGGLLAGVLLVPGAAYADPGNGNGNGNGGSQQPATPPGQEKKATPPPGQDNHATPPGQEGKATPPGQAKPKPNPQANPNPGTPRRNGNAPAKPTNGDPAGNNGTIKIDYPAPADSGHANRPHPGCSFQLRMFNFDDDQYGALTITGQAPTRTGTLLSRRILLSSDPAGGGQDVDEVYSFSAADLGLLDVPRAHQGWHIKVAVNAENAPGGAKQKVLWLDCPVPEAAPAPQGVIQPPAAARPSIVTADLAPEQPMGNAVIEANAQQRPALVRFLGGGGGVLRGAAAALPFTGLPAALLVAIGLGAVVLGVMAVTASRRRVTR
jgi:hypothetical protein